MTNETHDKLALQVALLWAETSKHGAGVPANPAAFGAMAAHAYLGAMAVLKNESSAEAVTAASTPLSALSGILKSRAPLPAPSPNSQMQTLPNPAGSEVSA